MYKGWLVALALCLAFPASARLSAYVSGGVGEDEREALLPHKNEFNRVESDGPFFFAQLAPASYTVSATYAGETQSRRVTLTEKRATALQLYWDDPAAFEGKGMEPERPRKR